MWELTPWPDFVFVSWFSNMHVYSSEYHGQVLIFYYSSRLLLWFSCWHLATQSTAATSQRPQLFFDLGNVTQVEGNTAMNVYPSAQALVYSLWALTPWTPGGSWGPHVCPTPIQVVHSEFKSGSLWSALFLSVISWKTFNQDLVITVKHDFMFCLSLLLLFIFICKLKCSPIFFPCC